MTRSLATALVAKHRGGKDGRLLARGAPAAIVGVVVALAASGGYAVAGSSSSKSISACARKHGGGLYVGKCAKRDKKLNWSVIGPTGPAGAIGHTGPGGPRRPRGPPGATGATGPQGPRATKLVYNDSGTAAPPGTTIGAMGPYTVTATCTQPASGTTDLEVFVTGPGGQLDGLSVTGTPPSTAPISEAIPTVANASLFGSISSTSTTSTTDVGQVLWLPSSGGPSTLLTASATGGATNTCHFSADTAITAITAEPSTAAASKPPGPTTPAQASAALIPAPAARQRPGAHPSSRDHSAGEE